MFDKLYWMTVNQLVAFHTCIAVYRIKKNGQPDYLNNIFNDMLSNGKIRLPRYKLETAERSFSIRGAKLWNNLPLDVKSREKIESFKISLKRWISKNVP